MEYIVCLYLAQQHYLGILRFAQNNTTKKVDVHKHIHFL